MVVQIRQRRRQQKLSGYNEYFESLKSSDSTNKSSPKETADNDTKRTSATNRQAFSTARNYLDAIKPATTQPSAAPTKKSQGPKITSRKISGASNYLDNLSWSQASSPKTPSKAKQKNGSNKLNGKDRDEKKDQTMVCDRNNLKEGEEHSLGKFKKNPPQHRTFAPGKGSNYLESLSTISNATSSGDSTLGAPERKGKQSTEISKNPYLNEVRVGGI